VLHIRAHFPCSSAVGPLATQGLVSPPAAAIDGTCLFYTVETSGTSAFACGGVIGAATQAPHTKLPCRAAFIASFARHAIISIFRAAHVHVLACSTIDAVGRTTHIHVLACSTVDASVSANGANSGILFAFGAFLAF
jgi:hypothetical protein